MMKMLEDLNYHINLGDVFRKTSQSPKHFTHKKEITLSPLNITSSKHIPLEISQTLASPHISRQKANSHLT